MTVHYRLDVSSITTVAICELCGERVIGLGRDEAVVLIRQHLMRSHPASKAALSAERQVQRQRHGRAA